MKPYVHVETPEQSQTRLIGEELDAAGVYWESVRPHDNGGYKIDVSWSYPYLDTWIKDSEAKLGELGYHVVLTGSDYDKIFHSTDYWIWFQK